MIISLTVQSVNFVNVATSYTQGFDDATMTAIITNPNTSINGNTQFCVTVPDLPDTVYTVTESVSYIASLTSTVSTIRDKAMSGDMVIAITPATVAASATASAWTRNVLVSVETAAGDVHSWLNHAYTTKVDRKSVV